MHILISSTELEYKRPKRIYFFEKQTLTAKEKRHKCNRSMYHEQKDEANQCTQISPFPGAVFRLILVRNTTEQSDFLFSSEKQKLSIITSTPFWFDNQSILNFKHEKYFSKKEKKKKPGLGWARLKSRRRRREKGGRWHRQWGWTKRSRLWEWKLPSRTALSMALVSLLSPSIPFSSKTERECLLCFALLCTFFFYVFICGLLIVTCRPPCVHFCLGFEAHSSLYVTEISFTGLKSGPNYFIRRYDFFLFLIHTWHTYRKYTKTRL